MTWALAEEGVYVVAGARNMTASRLERNPHVHPVSIDLSTPDGPKSLVDEAVSAHGGLDILVNNVGAVRPRLRGFLSITDEDWILTLTLNFLAAVRTTRGALPHPLERGPGNIVTICSVNAFLPDPAGSEWARARLGARPPAQACGRRALLAEAGSEAHYCFT